MKINHVKEQEIKIQGKPVYLAPETYLYDIHEVIPNTFMWNC